jgi:hypothetical protein
MTTNDQPGDGWTLVLRRQPAWIVDGAPEGGYAADFELICCDCGDDPDLDYCEIRPRLQLVRGPYTIAAGVAAYEQHSRLHQQLRATCWPATMSKQISASRSQHASELRPERDSNARPTARRHSPGVARCG